MTKAQCSKAGKSLAKTGSSSAGKALAQCRWDKPKKKAAPKKPKAARPGARQSRRLAGKGPVRGPEPPKKPRKKPAKKKAPKRGVRLRALSAVPSGANTTDLLRLSASSGVAR